MSDQNLSNENVIEKSNEELSNEETSNVDTSNVDISNVELSNVEEDELIGDVSFGETVETRSAVKSNVEDNVDTSKYTMIDNLDEDSVIENQRYALFSFLSPEGIMNCNIRALKFRGAFPTIEKAKKYVEKLKMDDKYFKIFLGEQGKWMEFDPPDDKVEEEIADDPKAQKIIDAQRKQRDAKMNEMAGRFKNQYDKNQSTSGKKERVDENLKASAAETEAQKRLEKRKGKKQNVVLDSGREMQKNKLKESMRKKLQKRREAEKLKREDLEKVSGNVQESQYTNDTTDEKIKVVNKAVDEIYNDKQEMDKVDEKINKIRNLMKNRNKD